MRADYLGLKVMKLVLALHVIVCRLSDLTVRCTLVHNGVNIPSVFLLSLVFCSYQF